MKNLKMLICILTAILLVATIFAVLPALSSQPPLDTSTMWVGTIGQPKNVDPSQAYDTASGELIMNVYDSMLEFGSEGTNIADKPVLPVSPRAGFPANDSIDVGTDVAMLGTGTDIPGVCEMPTVTLYANGSSLWTFQVKTNLVFQPWQKPDGTWVIDENITWQDIVYYFQRFFVQDSHNSPEWMLMGPAFNLSSFDQYQVGAGPDLGHSESYVASLIQNFAHGFSNATGQYVQMFFQYPAVGMYDILCETWSSIPPMQWSIDHGCWNDSFYSGWSIDWRRFPSDLFTPLDEHTSRSLYSSASAEPAMCGTGPYSFTYWNQATEQWRIDAFEAGYGNEPTNGTGCVSHPWPGPYDVAGSDPSEAAPTTVIETGESDWAMTKTMFLAGDLDICDVPEAGMSDLLQSPSTPYAPIPGVRLYYDIPSFETDAIFFTFNVSASSQYVPIVNGNPDPTFFSDIRVRTAFCQALNMSAYISEAWHGEATQPSTWWTNGLTPANANLNPSSGNPGAIPGWDINVANVYGNLTAAGITSFDIPLLYNADPDYSNTVDQIALQMIANTFAYINAWDNNTTHYQCTVASENSQIYMYDCEASNLPLFVEGWIADFSDADDFAVPFMASWGSMVWLRAYAPWQVYSNSTIDSQIQAEEALADASYNLTAGSAYMNRTAIFETLQEEYKEQAISLPIDQPTLSHWQREWVYGYYVNQLYSGNYYQDLFKNANLMSFTSVTCSPISVAAGSIVNCNVTVAGSNPTGTVTWSTSSSTGSFTENVCTLSNGSCSTTYIDTGPGIATITASYGGDGYNMQSSGAAALTVFVSEANSTTILGGNAMVDQTSITGVSVNVTGSSAPDGTSLNITSTNYGNAVPPSVTGAVTVGGAIFYDVQASSNDTLGPDATAIIRVTNPNFTSLDIVMFYWNGNSWISVPTQFIEPDIAYGNFSMSDLTGTPIMLQSNVHDVAVISLAEAKTVIGQGFTANISVTVANDGGYSENFKVTAYASFMAIGSENVSLSAGNSTTVTFTWNTTDFPYDSYTISAYAWPVPGQTNTANNTSTGGVVTVTIPGDINADGIVDIYDAIILAGAFNSKLGSPNWNPNADINGDGIVDIYDAIILSDHFGQYIQLGATPGLSQAKQT